MKIAIQSQARKTAVLFVALLAQPLVAENKPTPAEFADDHYGHLELPRQLAAAHYAVVRWFLRSN